MSLPIDNKILVDTSVFVDFLRNKDVPRFEQMLLNNQVWLSSYVRLELLQGVRKNEMSKLEYALGGIEPIREQQTVFQTAEIILRKIRGHGIAIGIVDLLIAAESRILDCPIYSLDKVFRKLASLKIVSLWDQICHLG